MDTGYPAYFLKCFQILIGKIGGTLGLTVLTLCGPMDLGHQAPPSMGFSREYWNGLPFASPGDLPDPGVEPRSPALQADVLLSEPPGKFP